MWIPLRKTVTGDDGSVTRFDKLLLATGSQPLIPAIEDVQKDGVFVFRTLDDTRALLERARPGVKAVVIGGGLLGLEAARGLQVQGCDVTVVHLMETLMKLQLDVTGGSYLATKMNEMGVDVLLGYSTRAVLGNGKVEGVQFKGGGSIPADMVVIAAGIVPNVELGSKGGPQGQARNRGQRLHGNLRIPTSSPWANAWSTTASAMDWWRRCWSRARCWPPPSPATRGRRIRARCSPPS